MSIFSYSGLSSYLILASVALAYTSPVEERQSGNAQCTCGQTVNARIIGGENAGSIPWRVGIFTVKNGEQRGSLCGATILDKNWIMTAAHCVDVINPNQKKDYSVYISSGSNTLRFARDKSVDGTSVFINENWKPNTVDNDIAMIRIPDSVLNFTDPNTAPACLPYKFRNMDLSGKVLASGWGRTSNEGGTSNYLQQAYLNMYDWKKCNQILKENNVSNRLDDTKICTKTPNTDICEGDSGGSVDYLDGGNYYAVGINSFVMGKCANPKAVSVMTKVTAYLDWIKTTTGRDFCGK